MGRRETLLMARALNMTAAYASLGFITKALTLPLISYLPPAFVQATGLSLGVPV